MIHDYEVFTEPDAHEQAFPFDPSTADRGRVDAERARERAIREDQRDRTLAELAKYFEADTWPAQIIAHVTTDPGW